MRAAGLALACIVIGGGMALGYLAADREYLASLRVLAFLNRDQGAPISNGYPQTNRDGKHDQLLPLRTDRAELELGPNLLKRGDSLRQSYAAVDPAMEPAQPLTGPLPLPRPRPKVWRLQSSYTLLSDLQIDAIKARLKLTEQQERAWPAVEEALRGLAARLHARKRVGEATTELPPDDEEIVRLKAAATPFFAQLSAQQKRELKMLAHVIGLGKVMAQL